SRGATARAIRRRVREQPAGDRSAGAADTGSGDRRRAVRGTEGAAAEPSRAAHLTEPAAYAILGARSEPQRVRRRILLGSSDWVRSSASGVHPIAPRPQIKRPPTVDRIVPF